MMRQRLHTHFVDLAWVRGSDSPGASCGARKCRLLSAFRELHRADPSIHLLLVGDGPLRSQFEKEVQNAGLIQAVTFAGALGHEDVPSMWPRCFPARQLQVSVRYHF